MGLSAWGRRGSSKRDRRNQALSDMMLNLARLASQYAMMKQYTKNQMSPEEKEALQTRMLQKKAEIDMFVSDIQGMQKTGGSTGEIGAAVDRGAALGLNVGEGGRQLNGVNPLGIKSTERVNEVLYEQNLARAQGTNVLAPGTAEESQQFKTKHEVDRYNKQVEAQTKATIAKSEGLTRSSWKLADELGTELGLSQGETANLKLGKNVKLTEKDTLQALIKLGVATQPLIPILQLEKSKLEKRQAVPDITKDEYNKLGEEINQHELAIAKATRRDITLFPGGKRVLELGEKYGIIDEAWGKINEKVGGGVRNPEAITSELSDVQRQIDALKKGQISPPSMSQSVLAPDSGI